MMGEDSLQDWFRTPLGELVAAAEREAVGRMLADCRPGFLVQLGAMGDSTALPVAGAVRQWIVDRDDSVRPCVRAWQDDLPFRSRSVDTLVMVHQLEFEHEPHALLREAERVLAPEGHMLLLAFNPMSLWGLGRVVGPLWGGAPPWCGHYYTGLRLRDWCRVLGLEHRQHERVFFRPPLQRPGIQQRLQALERMGRRFWPALGGVNAQLYRKRVCRAIPMGAVLQRKRTLAADAPAAAHARRRTAFKRMNATRENRRDLQ
ncbi:methyltransferase domain-containing protein [Aquisalimonas sp.]|uniref:methyltransferase domain-containing protein n=1 Tax=Aquisalimonas sp. TaxID=1872621 RepID=UPI0025BB5242|nr:methyltransferase domain-containing protein [Aquisalimonas sp.]